MTQKLTLAAAWQSLNTGLSLVNGTAYLLQNTGSWPIHVCESGAEPASDGPGVVLAPLDTIIVTPAEGKTVYARSSSTLAACCTTTEAE